jgi:hypothetical protein
MTRQLLWMFVSGALVGACSPSQTTTRQALEAEGCVVNDARACDPADTKKTTVCHIPPGNPANAHTICIGNPAVDAHLAHGDILGECTCPGDGGGEVVDAGVDACPDDAGSGSGSDAGEGSGSGSGSGSDGTIY